MLQEDLKVADMIRRVASLSWTGKRMGSGSVRDVQYLQIWTDYAAIILYVMLHVAHFNRIRCNSRLAYSL